MSLSTLSNSDSVCPGWRDKINATITFLNGLVSIQAVPVGAVIEWEGNLADSTLWDVNGNGVAASEMQNFAICLGQALTGATAKNPDGTTRTTAPNRIGKFSVMLDSGDVDFATIGLTGGAKTITLTQLQSALRGHTHTYLSPGGSGGAITGSGSWIQGDEQTSDVKDVDGTTGNDGGQDANDAHDNLPPFYVCAKIIRYK